MARPSKGRQAAAREARRRQARIERRLMEPFLAALETWAYVTCEACGQEQGQYAESSLPCVICGHGLARYHPEMDALKATFRSEWASVE